MSRDRPRRHIHLASLGGLSEASEARDIFMKIFAYGLVLSLAASAAAHAGSWRTVRKHVHPTGNFSGQEVLASYYWIGTHTASGEVFDINADTGAARSWPLGTRITVTNPQNGRTITVRINDRGPYGEAWRQGARLDLALGVARRLGMSSAQYVCVN
jgi:rare lipoprotein A